MAAKPKLTPQQRQRILDVVSARRALPSDKQLARELGVSVSAIYRTVESMLHDIAVSKTLKAGKVLGCQRLERLRMLSGNAS